jgi:hypothetical protein
MSSASKLDTTFSTSWRTTAATNDASTSVDHVAVASKPGRPSGAIFYTEPSGADLFPGKELIRALFRKLRRS